MAVKFEPGTPDATPAKPGSRRQTKNRRYRHQYPLEGQYLPSVMQRKLNPMRFEQLVTMSGWGTPKARMARAVGIHPDTLTNWLTEGERQLAEVPQEEWNECGHLVMRMAQAEIDMHAAAMDTLRKSATETFQRRKQVQTVDADGKTTTQITVEDVRPDWRAAHALTQMESDRSMGVEVTVDRNGVTVGVGTPVARVQDQEVMRDLLTLLGGNENLLTSESA